MGGDYITSDYVRSDIMNNLLSVLTYENRLAVLTSMCTGLRISDVLSIKSEKLKSNRFTVKEMKTGKTRKVVLPMHLYSALCGISGRYFVFEHRLKQNEHRQRQTVWADLKRAKKAFRITSLHISPHSARKIYSVECFKKSDLKNVQKLLNHSSEAVTVLYAMADTITERRLKQHGNKLPKQSLLDR